MTAMDTEAARRHLAERCLSFLLQDGKGAFTIQRSSDASGGFLVRIGAGWLQVVAEGDTELAALEAAFAAYDEAKNE